MTNLIYSERERLAYINGTITPDLATSYAVLEALDGTGGDIFGDIRAGFPDEDCLQAEIDELRAIANGLRKGPTRIALTALLQKLESRQDELARSAEYGRDELAKAQRVWDAVLEAAE